MIPLDGLCCSSDARHSLFWSLGDLPAADLSDLRAGSAQPYRTPNTSTCLTKHAVNDGHVDAKHASLASVRVWGLGFQDLP